MSETPDAVLEAQTANHSRHGWTPGRGVVWAIGWATLLFLAIWLSSLTPIWLWLAALGSAAWSVAAVRSHERLRLAGMVMLWASLTVAAGVQHRLSRVVNDWSILMLEIEQRSESAADEALNELLDQGERAVQEAEAAVETARTTSGEELFEQLARIERTTGVTAIVLFDSTGTAVAWSGEHRGPVPIEARFGAESYIFREGPLFSYLYFVRPLASGLTAAAAFLLEGSIQAEEGVVSFADQFQEEHGPRPEFWVPERAPPDAIWDWATDDGPIFSVSLLALTQQNWWQRISSGGRRGAGALVFLTLIALSAAWYHSRERPAGLPALVGVAVALVAPLPALTESGLLFSPLQFVLPGPFDITLGVLLVLLIGSSIWLLTLGRALTPRVRPLAAAALLGGVFVLAISLVTRSASDGLLASRAAGGFTLQLATTLLIAIPTFVILRHTSALAVRPVRGRVVLAAGYALPAVLGLAVAWTWQPGLALSPLLAALWLLPSTLILVGHGELSGRSTLRIWLIAGWLAGTLSLAFLWPLHIRAELTRAGQELTTLGTRPDPFLDYLLRQFSERAQVLAEEGEGGVNLLYHAWMASGLAREGYEARMSVWTAAEVEADLNLSDLTELPARAITDVLAAGDESGVLHYGGVGGLHYLLVVPVGDDRTVSVAVPPRRQLASSTALARFLYPEAAPTTAGRAESLYLVPVDPGGSIEHADVAVEPETVRWIRTPRGWRSETMVEMPEGPAHAHLLIDMASVPLLLTRAVLAQAGLLASLLLIWGAGRLLSREGESIHLGRPKWVRTFRGRLSAALFFFFLLPTLVFGAASYSAVAREVIRSAAALAQQALNQAATRLPDVPLADLGGTINTDLLMYQNGSISAASAPEIIELGLFHTWLPPAVYSRFVGGEELVELEERSVAASEYLIAYRRLDATTVLAAPIPLASNEIQRRRQEFRDVAILVVLMGLGLSVVLALMVSRALARPLDELSRAAVTVGSGNLRTRLPAGRSDEFGNVYESFNRMVRRLRQTRMALIKETRRTETIVAEAATGVLALDGERRIELVNPRAAQLLGGDCRAGDTLSAPGSETAAAILRLIAEDSPEATAEVETDAKIVRIKLRRLAGEDGTGGVVVALEDVTSDVRTARVLAWGEMARQVAHEIKNPLTPIKLAVQHLRRAFIDGRPDFGVILDRNVESILLEIDRLGEIARAFSRFGTPSANESPLDTVDVRQVVSEVLALYQSSGNIATFRAEFPTNDLPAVVARSDEMKEVLVNLLENAREAVAESGNVIVSAEILPSGGVLLAVTDDGVGIPEGQLSRIFDPHFSTRSSGTGLGLAIVRRLVESWNGSVVADSAEGEGTRVEIRLQAAPGDAA